jgi:hypothetical protein
MKPSCWQVMMAERMKRGIKAEMEEAREILVCDRATSCFHQLA